MEETIPGPRCATIRSRTRVTPCEKEGERKRVVWGGLPVFRPKLLRYKYYPSSEGIFVKNCELARLPSA